MCVICVSRFMQILVCLGLVRQLYMVLESNECSERVITLTAVKSMSVLLVLCHLLRLYVKLEFSSELDVHCEGSPMSCEDAGNG